ncbi:ATP-binding protein [Ideonella sp.]|uniref:hybrid sensor histidine kinase/response regulator n=1 Tax=Ideonella sp. TaxID=1929293 RepID=UPI002B489BDF|nr:ATP-binding protein [Ideonella sp.]HJV70761.1 ATP-binding protein [Ideonella sp.]
MGARRFFLSAWPGYAVALAVTALALGLQWALRPWLDTRNPFICFWPAIVLAAVLAGRGPGWLPLIAGLASAVRWLSPAGTLAVTLPSDRISLLLFAVFGASLIEFGTALRRTGERAVAAEERLVLAIQGTGIGVFDIDLVAETAYASPALARLVGLPVSSSAVPLARWVERAPPALLAESRARLAEKLREHARSYERELQVPQTGGAPLWMLLRVHLSWSGERVVRLRGACVDITERKAVDAQLARTRADLSQQVDDLDRMHDLSSHLPEAGSLHEQLQMVLETLAHFHGATRGIVSLWDTAAGGLALQAQLGFDDAELRRLAVVRPGQGACGLACAGRERVVIADTETDDRFAVWRDFAREQAFRAVHSTPLLGQDGTVLGMISVFLDTAREPTERERALADICVRKAAVFCERARAQAALEESQGRFRAVLEASAVPFILLAPQRDEHGEIVDFTWSYVNRAAADVLERRAEDLVGHRMLEQLPRHWKDSSAFRQYMAVAREGEVREFEMHTRLRGGDGWLHCIASPMRDAVAVWFNDITDRKRNEQLLREADRRKDEFLATLAHELRNPLAPIRQAALLSTSRGATEAQKRWSHEVIDRQVQHMALLLDDLLDVSRITRGVLALRKTGTELAAVIASAVETARPMIDGMGHALEVNLPPGPEHFEADPLRIAQVVANLLTNAAKYTDRGGRIRLDATRAGREIVIEVSDDGIGISPESLPEVFRMFSQLNMAGERSSAGLGIGLALSKGLVELHGGSIAVRSEGPGTGSTFTVRLPVGQVAVDGDPLGSPQPAAATPRRVLIADDNRDAADSLAALLQLDGHETRLSFDGDEALAAYERFAPDVCLFDIGMPGRNGYELARTIRGLPGGKRPVLIAITGWGQENDRRLAMQAGFDHHLTKPVDPRRLARLFEAGAPLGAGA